MLAEPRERWRVAQTRDRDAGLPTEVRELWELILTYAKQQTLDPLKALGRFVAYGVAGAILIGLGSLLLAVGVLRAVQFEAGDHFDGSLSWVPYVAAVAFCVLVAAGMVWQISKTPAGEER